MSNATYTREVIQQIAKSLIGKTFGELNGYQLKGEHYNKGSHGHILEEDVFHYDINSKSAPDFEDAGIELKVTPYKINKDGSYSAKERLVLNIINYMEEYKNTFYTSHFWEKNKLTQIVWYLNEEGKPKDEFIIDHELLFTFPEEDLLIIKKDWETIIDKIRNGKAHEISEADTMYLGACTKGANANSVRKQPFSDIMAKQRAFCLKTSYMTQLVRWYIGGENIEKICSDLNKSLSFEDYITQKLLKFKGVSVNQLCNRFGLSNSSKNLNELLLARMLGIHGRVAQTEEFLKANIIPKTIRITENGRIIESMSFPTFKYNEIVTQRWEESDLFEMFSTTKFMFAVFVEKNGIYYFEKIKFWNMPMPLLESDVKSVWLKTVDVIKSGNIVREIKNGKRMTNFPGMSDNRICHVRPHGQNVNDVYPLPVKDVYTGLSEYTKHCFWLNNTFVKEIIDE